MAQVKFVTWLAGLVNKSTPTDNDQMYVGDAGVSKYTTWAQVKATLKTYFDSLTTTFTNKRITLRTVSITSSATPSIDTDATDVYLITAQTEAITGITVTGTPTNSQGLIVAITGTASRAITWGASFEASTVALPTTTSGTAKLTVGFIWNSATSKWRCVGVA